MSGFICSILFISVLATVPIAENIGETAVEIPVSVISDEEPGDTLSRIVLPEGWIATVYCVGLSGADGLAISPGGVLYVAEESAGCISAVTPSGTVTPFATGLSSPEGIAFNSAGYLFVAEDVEDGSLYSIDTAGVSTELVSGLDAPEGVTVEADGDILVTESTVQFVGSPWDYRTSVTRIFADGTEEELQYSQFLWSYSGIAFDSSGTIYVCNEASGTGTNNSVFKINPVTGVRTLFVDGLIACEGLRFSPGDKFPLYVVEEDLGSGNGRLSVVDRNGICGDFATGFYTIEDVLVDDTGRIFVSEDATGMIILLERTVGIESAGEVVSPEILSAEIFPNPFSGFIQVDLHTRECIQINIDMYNLAGRSVLESMKESIASGETSYIIDTDNLDTGVYYLCISSSLGMITVSCIRRQNK